MSNIEKLYIKRKEYIDDLIEKFKHNGIQLELECDVDSFNEHPLIKKFKTDNSYYFVEEIIRGENKGFSEKLKPLSVKEWNEFIGNIHSSSTVYMFIYVNHTHPSYHNSLALFKVNCPEKLSSLFKAINESLSSNVDFHDSFYIYQVKNNKIIYYYYEYDGVFKLQIGLENIK